MRPRRPRSRSSSGAPRPAPTLRVRCSRRWREMAVMDDRLLTAAEEIKLAKRIERGDLAAKQEMIERNLRLLPLRAPRESEGGAPPQQPPPGGAPRLGRPPAEVA